MTEPAKPKAAPKSVAGDFVRVQDPIHADEWVIGRVVNVLETGEVHVKWHGPFGAEYSICFPPDRVFPVDVAPPPEPPAKEAEEEAPAAKHAQGHAHGHGHGKGKK